jgi:hypothetical protein
MDFMHLKQTKELRDLRERNEERLKLAKEKLGDKWLLHPTQQIPRKSLNLIK